MGVLFVATLLFLAILSFYGEDKKTAVESEDYLLNNNTMNYNIKLETTIGDIVFETYAQYAPNTVNNFITLAKEGFYDGLTFHRVIPGFMIQGGCPVGNGTGGPGYSFSDEIDGDNEVYQRGYKKGVVAMANAGPNTQGSQFFIMVEDVGLPSDYTIFGKVVSGQDIADAVSLVETAPNDMPIEDVVIIKVSVEEIVESSN